MRDAAARASRDWLCWHRGVPNFRRKAGVGAADHRITRWLLLLLLSIVYRPHAAQRIDLPPGYNSFPVSFTSEEMNESKNTWREVTLDIRDGDDVLERARAVVAALYDGPRPDVEQAVVDAIVERLQVFRSEDHRRLTPAENERPAFSLRLDDSSSVAFYPGDSVQFALQRYYHGSGVAFDDVDLYSRDALLLSLHQRKLAYIEGLCPADGRGGEHECRVAQCKLSAPVFVGYEHAQAQSNVSPSQKRSLLLEGAYRAKVTDCVETGTFEGDTTLFLAESNLCR